MRKATEQGVLQPVHHALADGRAGEESGGKRGEENQQGCNVRDAPGANPFVRQKAMTGFEVFAANFRV
jgi:hypothetical protein